MTSQPDVVLSAAIGTPVPIRVLQLEDSAEDAEIALLQLQRAGFVCVACRVDTRAAFLAALDEFKADVILADYKLPAFDGGSALTLVRASRPEIPVIVVSGVLDDEGAVELMKAGAKDFVLKDRMARLGPAVRRALERERERRARHAAEQALKASELQFRTLFESAPIATLLADSGGIIQQVNRAFTALLGYAEDEVMGKSIEDITIPADRELTQQQGHAADHGVALLRYEKHYLHKDGHSVPAIATLSASAIGDKKVMIGQIADLTAIRRSADELTAAHERLQTATEGAGAGVWEIDLLTRQMIWDATVRRQYGLADSDPDLTLSAWLQRLHPDDRVPVEKKIEAALGPMATTFDADFRVPLADGRLRWYHSFGRVHRDADGRAVRASGINIDITEARHLQEEARQYELALAASERRFRALSENAADIIVVADARGRITYTSASIQAIAGYGPNDLIGRGMLEFIDPAAADEFMSNFADITSEPGRVIRVERRYRMKDGSLRLFESVAKNLLQDPAVNGVVVNLRDVTENRAMKQSLQESELRLRKLLENTADVILILQPDATISYVSPAITDVCGYEPQALVGQSYFQLVFAEDIAAVKANLATLVVRPSAAMRVERRLRHKDGSARVLDAVINNQMAVAGIDGMVVNMRDITERKRAERDRKLFRELIDRASDAILVMAPDTLKLLDVNRGATERFGYSREELLSMSVFDLDSSISRAKVDSTRQALLESGSVLLDSISRRKDGSTFPVEVSLSSVQLDRSYMVASVRDISERRRAEQEAARKETWFKALVDNIEDLIIVMNVDGRISYVSPAVTKIGGYEPEALLGRSFTELTHPDDLKTTETLFATLLLNPASALRGEMRARHRDGSWRAFETSNQNLIAVPGVNGIVVTMHDITERQAIAARMQMAKLLIEQSPSVLFRWAAEPGWPVTYVSENVRRWGYEPEELLSGPTLFTDLMHPDDVARIAAETEASLSSGASQFAQVYRVIKRSGETIWLDDRTTVERDAAGTVVAFQGVAMDITERRLAETALRDNEATLSTVTGAAMDAVILIDNDGRIGFWNKAAESILGYSRAEAIGMDLHSVLAPARYLEVAQKAFELFRDSGEGALIGKTVELLARRKDGVELPVELALSAVELKGRWNAVGIMRDISERKRSDAAKQAELRRAEQQLEAVSRITAAEALASGDVVALARQITAAAAAALGAERVNAWLFNENETELRCIDLFEATAAKHSAGVVLKESEFGNEFRALKTSRYVAADDPYTDPRTAGYVDGYLKPLRITSMLDVMIETSGKHLGLLCVEHVDKPHQWVADDITFVSQLADKLGLCIANRSRHRATSELQEAQRVAHLGNWRLELAGGEVIWSDEVYRIFQRDPATPAPTLKQHPELMTADSYAQLDAAIVACQRDGVPYQVELALPHAGGEWRWVAARGEALRDDSGVIVALRGTVQDITERKRSEDALRESQQITEGILNAIPVRVFWKDRDLAYLGCNAAFARDAGFSSPTEVIGKNDHQMVWHDQAESYRADDRAVIDSGKAKLFVEEPQTIADGSIVTLLTSKTPLRDARGEISGVLGTYMDITERKRQEKVLLRTSRALAALSRGSGALVHAQSEAVLYAEMTRAIVEAGGYRMAWVGLAEHGEDRAIRPVGTAGDGSHYSEQAKISWGDGEHGAGPAGECVRSGQMQVCRDIATDARMAPWRQAALAAGLTAMVALPLDDDAGQTFGVLSIYTDDPAALDEPELPLLQEMAADLAYGIGHLRAADQRRAATEKLRLSLEGTIGALGATMEARDPYTAGHQRKVATLAEAIGVEMGLSALIVEGLHFGSMIHDIGKIQVPSELLTKPTRLSKLEFELIKTHPRSGYEIVKDIEFPWPIAQMVQQHHERLDGSGYPQGLKGDEIILEARIIAVADVIEAMSSHRPYRPGLGIEVALAEIENNKGTQFDPAVVDACLKLFREKHFTL